MTTPKAPAEPPTGNLDGQDQTDELAEDSMATLPPPRNHDPARWIAII